MTHFLKTPKANRPNLKTRKLEGADHIEAQCEKCGAFRPGFCINNDTTPGPKWECDGCFSDWRRKNHPELYS